jgi:hypothetical protein
MLLGAWGRACRPYAPPLAEKLDEGYQQPLDPSPRIPLGRAYPSIAPRLQQASFFRLT